MRSRLVNADNSLCRRRAGRARSRIRGLRRLEPSRYTLNSSSGVESDRARPRLLVLNQYYWPGRRGDRAPPLRALRGARRRVRRHRRHRTPPCREDEPDHERATASRSSACTRPRSTGAPLRRRAANYVTYLASALRRGAHRAAAGRRALHDRSAGGRRRRAPRRAPLRAPLVVISQDVFPEIAVELKRLENPSLVGRPARADRLLPRARRPRRRDRRDDADAARSTKGAPAERIERDPELGRHRRDHAAAAATTSGRASTGSSTASSSCTPATSATRRTSTRSSALRRSCATSTTSRSS